MPKKTEFEDKMLRLEDIAEKLNSPDATLNESIKLYEEGSKLLTQLNKELDAAEKKVKILTEGIDSSLEDYE